MVCMYVHVTITQLDYKERKKERRSYGGATYVKSGSGRYKQESRVRSETGEGVCLTDRPTGR